MELETLKNLGFNESEIDKYIDHLVRNHDTNLTSFTVNVPNYPDPATMRSPQDSFGDPKISCWYKYNHVDIKRNSFLKRIYTDLKSNFTYEITGYNDKKGLSEIWLLRSCTFLPKIIPSQNFYATGIAAFHVSEDAPTVSFTWVHPYLRGQKLFSTLIRKLMIEKGVILIEPPTTKVIEIIMQNLLKEAFEQPKIFGKFFSQSIEISRKRYPFVRQHEKGNEREIFKIYARVITMDEVLKLRIKNDKQRVEMLTKLSEHILNLTEVDAEELKKYFPDCSGLDFREIMNFNVCKPK